MSNKREQWNPLLCNYPDSEKVNRVSFEAETLFTRLIARCDDNGNFNADETILMCKLFAIRFRNRTVSVTDVARMRDELIQNDLIFIYERDGEKYLHIKNVKKHLRRDIKPDIRFPEHPKEQPQLFDLKQDTKSGKNPGRIRDESVPEPAQGRNENVSSTTTTTTTTTTSTTTLYDTFSQACKIYPGTKRGCRTEFLEFGKKHKDWKEIIPKLIPAIQSQIESRKSKMARKEFVPEWKHFKTWLNQRCWEEEVADNKPQESGKECVVCKGPGVKYDTDRRGKRVYLCSECLRFVPERATWGFSPPEKIIAYIASQKAKMQSEECEAAVN